MNNKLKYSLIFISIIILLFLSAHLYFLTTFGWMNRVLYNQTTGNLLAGCKIENTDKSKVIERIQNSKNLDNLIRMVNDKEIDVFFDYSTRVCPPNNSGGRDEEMYVLSINIIAKSRWDRIRLMLEYGFEIEGIDTYYYRAIDETPDGIWLVPSFYLKDILK